MNCQEFEQTLIDLGRDYPMEAPVRARALEHAEICAQCAARLNREQRMTAGLQTLAVEEAAINAPERVRSALRAALDEQQAAAASPPVLIWPVRRRLLWGMAAAAMLLLSSITTALWLREQGTKVDDTQAEAINKPTPPTSPGKRPDASAGAQQSGGIHSSKAVRPSGKQSRRRTPRVKESADDAGELFPLTFVAKTEPTEFVQIVRIEISRSTLMSMGLPINIDRGEGLIKADIIIGEDGVARAVRIIN
jgi:hypothetical protein